MGNEGWQADLPYHCRSFFKKYGTGNRGDIDGSRAREKACRTCKSCHCESGSLDGGDFCSGMWPIFNKSFVSLYRLITSPWKKNQSPEKHMIVSYWGA